MKDQDIRRMGGRVLGMMILATAMLANSTMSWAKETVTPKEIWREVQALQKAHAVMPESRPYQLGSRTVDYYTIDLSNTLADKAILAAGGITRVKKYPNGSLVVKENFNKQKKEVAVTAMLKLSGFDAGDRDWVMASYKPSGQEVAFGRVDSCISCHVMVKKADFVFAPPPDQLLSKEVWHTFFPTQVVSPAYARLLQKYPHAIVR